MARISFVEFLCIVAIGVAMVEIPEHELILSPGPSVASSLAGARVEASTAEYYVRAPMQERRR